MAQPPVDVKSLRVLLRRLTISDDIKFEDDLMKISFASDENRQNLLELLATCRKLAIVPAALLQKNTANFASAAAAITDLLSKIDNPSSFSEQQLLQSFQKCTAELRLLNPGTLYLFLSGSNKY